jgi:hypothetical protein
MRLAVPVLLLAFAACGDDDRPPPPSDGGPGTDAPPPPVDAQVDAPRERAPFFRNPVGLDNIALAFEAMRILGAPEAGATEMYCNECHPLTRETIQDWSALTNDTMGTCLTNLLVPTDESAAEMIACTRAPGGNYAASELGIVSTATDLEWFRYVFRHGTTGDWEAEHATFVEQAGMPPPGGHTPLTQEQFDVVMEWFRRDIPAVEAVLGGLPPLGDCMPSVGPEVATHLDVMATTGWRAANESASLLMYGCAGAATVRDCLATEPPASGTSYGADWDVIPGTTLRVLFTTDFPSSFWTRSSADGRFVGMGGGSAGGATVIDLQRDVEIPVDALYDPAFFPDNSGFIFHGGGAQFCEQSVLVGASMISFDEPGCTSPGGVGLYEHIGTSLGGADYWAVSGEFVSDNGGHSATLRDPSAGFSPGSRLTLTRMMNDGSGFTSTDTVTISTPNEGDTAISPSSRLLVSRAAGASGQEGFVLRLLDATVAAGEITSASAPVVGEYCYNGGKPGWSYDDRWLVLHHYIDGNDATDLGFTGASDPAFAPYLTQGAANVYLIDLYDGTRTRITNMAPGQYALFPHFRSDGWIYFIVRGEPGGEIIVASDAALEIE